jgi:lysophospholipase L1-like esterase
MHRFGRRSAAVTAGIVLAGLSLLGGITAAPASAASTSNSTSNSNPNNYLALGDSVPFGYNPLLVTPGVNPDVFVGYPQLASDLFRPRKKLFNASCPGETSTSLITGTRPDNGCQDYRQFIGPLHVSYPGSQLAYAESYLAANPRTGLVTMMIGANDLFLLINSCGGATQVTCIEDGLPALRDTLSSNLRTIYSGLKAAGFHGELVAVTYYSVNYADPVRTEIITKIDETLAKVTQAFGGKVANGFGEFQQAAEAFGGDSCKAGLLIHLTPTTCDVHPSPAGAALLAVAVRDAS